MKRDKVGRTGQWRGPLVRAMTRRRGRSVGMGAGRGQSGPAWRQPVAFLWSVAITVSSCSCVPGRSSSTVVTVLDTGGRAPQRRRPMPPSEYPSGSAQLLVLPLELTQPGPLLGRQPGSPAGVGLGHRTHGRNVSRWIDNFSEIDSITCHCDGYSSWCSKPIGTARSRTSGGCGGRPALFGSDICSSSQRDEQSPIPGRFNFSCGDGSGERARTGASSPQRGQYTRGPTRTSLCDPRPRRRAISSRHLPTNQPLGWPARDTNVAHQTWSEGNRGTCGR